jgi:restriction system protein
MLLAALDTSQSIDDMNVPGFRLHPLKGSERGRWSVWVNGNWRKKPTRKRGGGDLSSTGCLLLCVFVGGPLLLLALCQFASGYPEIVGLLAILVPVAIVVFIIFRLNRKEERKRKDFQAYQQYTAQVQAQKDAEQYHQQMGYREQIRNQQAIQQQNARQLQAQKERERLARLKTLGDLLTLTPAEFEEAIGKMLALKGLYNVQRVGGSGDLGVDLIANDAHGNRVVIQCKRYAPGRTIGTPDLQKFIGMMFVHHKAQRGIFVTTSTFKQTAIDLADDKDILLIDGNSLVNLMKSMTM